MSIQAGTDYTMDAKRRQLGAGADLCNANECSAKLLDALQCNISDMPVLLQSRAMFTGPLPSGTSNSLFGTTLDILSYGKNVPGAAETSVSGLNNGAASTFFLIVGVFMHLIPPPFNFTVEGGAISPPPSGVPGFNPVIPDEWTSGDATTSATGTGPLGLLTGQTLARAYLDYGNWIQQGFYQLPRAYNWMWTNGQQTTLLNWPARHIAKVIPSPQDNTAVGGTIDATPYIGDANQYYRQGGPAPGGTPATAAFRARNARRTGSVTIGATVVSTFEPDDSSVEVVPTYGGPGVEEMACNQEYFRLPSPIVFPRAVNLNMYLQATSSAALARARAAFSMGAPGPLAVAQDVAGYASTNGSGLGNCFTEMTQDLPPAQNVLVTPAGELAFKFGDWYIGIGCVGWELSESQYDQIKANQGEVCQTLQNQGHNLCFFGR